MSMFRHDNEQLPNKNHCVPQRGRACQGDTPHCGRGEGDRWFLLAKKMNFRVKTQRERSNQWH